MAHINSAYVHYQGFFDGLERQVMAGAGWTLKQLAEDHDVKPAAMRKHLVEHFGDRVYFTVGRTGGIRLFPDDGIKFDHTQPSV